MLKIIIPLLLPVLILSCSDKLPETSDSPANLTVQIQSDSLNPKKILIQATAENTVEYELWIGQNDEAYETNASGSFEYSFEQAGVYQIEIRAYGVSGRYLKAERQIDISEAEDVPLDEGYFSADSYEGYSLIWADEFDGNSVNTDNWVFEIGTGNWGWGNNELQYYKSENASVQDDVLIIEAREENVQGSAYTSARLKTQGKFDFRYGRVDIRALLPKGQGLWPALWMLGSNITSVGWPACGETDIMEMIGGNGRENQVHGTLHWDSDGHASTGGSYQLSQNTFADAYHVFSIIWNQTSVKWLVNDYKFHEIDITPQHMTEFHEKFFLIFNVAVGGNWPGSPNETTVFPQSMKVDYVRVFQAD